MTTRAVAMSKDVSVIQERLDHEELHCVQLRVAQPTQTRDAPPGFEHHAELPRVELAVATVLIGELAGAASPAL